MADEQSTETSVNTEVNTSADDTSTNDDTQDTDVENDLTDTDVSFDDFDDDDTEEADDSEAEDDSAAFDDDETEEDSEDDDETTEESTDDTEESQEQEESKEDKAAELERKRQNDEAAKQRIAERAQREAQVAQAKALAQQEYLQGAEDDKDLAVRQLQIDAYNNKIEGNTNKLTNSLEKAVATIDLFHKGTPEQQDALLEAIDEFEAMYVRKDRNGDPIEIKADVLTYLQRKADSIKRLSAVGARQQVKDKTNQKVRTLKTPSRAPQKPKGDPMLEGFDEEAYR